MHEWFAILKARIEWMFMNIIVSLDNFLGEKNGDI